MKKLLFLALAFTATFSLQSCKTEGCTDPDSLTYDSEADEDDGTCTYEGSVVFWYGKATSAFLLNDGAVSLSYYIDNTLVGSTAASVYWNGLAGPDCGGDGTISKTLNLGTNTSESVTYRIVDQTGFEYYSGNLTIDANTCFALELD